MKYVGSEEVVTRHKPGGGGAVETFYQGQECGDVLCSGGREGQSVKSGGGGTVGCSLCWGGGVV